MNEFRASLRDQSSKFVTRTEMDIIFRDVRELREASAELRGKASQNSVIVAYALAGISLLISIITVIKNIGG
jgi:hypothetical protein